MVNRIIGQLKAFPQEKTYTHVDAADYAAGDRIWLKVYVVNALSHQPTSESLYAYVELIAPDEAMTTRARILCRDGIYAGFIDIPPSTPSGRYLVRSYTELSANVPGYESVVPVYITGKGKARTTKPGNAPKSTDDDAASLIQYTRQGELIRITTPSPADSLYLLAHCRAYPFIIVPISQQRPVVLHRDSIPQGIVSLLLVNHRQQVLSERLLRSDNAQEQCQLIIQSDKEEYKPSEPIALTLTAPDLQEGELADISISITGPKLVQRHRPSSIVTTLLYATDVSDGIDAVALANSDAQGADALLSHQHWTRYDFSRMLRGDYVRPDHLAETSHTISGRVRTAILRRPVGDAIVSLISPQAGISASDTTDIDGCFSIPGMDFPNGTQYVLRVTDSNGKGNVELQLDEKERPDFVMPQLSDLAVDDFDIVADSMLSAASGSVLLEDIEVTGTLRNTASQGNSLAQLADFSFGLHKIEEINATCLHELIRRIPGIRIHDNRCYVRASTSIYADNPAAIAINGVIVPDEYDLDNIQMQDVARVDMYKTGNTAIWGAAGGSGIISIILKDGSYFEVEEGPMDQRSLTPLGYQKPSSFLSQSGPRKTLYWNPSITSNTLNLSASNTPGICHIVIEGVTTEGRLIHEEHDLLVTQYKENR